MKTPPLFEVPADRPSIQSRITSFKRKHGIVTHRSNLHWRDHPWIALKPFEDEQYTNMAEIMAHSCRLYDESNHLATGTGELSVIRKLCQQLEIPCDL